MRVALVALAATFGCSERVTLKLPALATGDAVIAVRHLGELEGARAERLDADALGRVELELEAGERLLLAPLRAEALITDEGAPLAPSALAVDLDGGGCCAAPHGASPHLIARGDRCPLPRAIDVLHHPTDRVGEPELELAIRERLRISLSPQDPPRAAVSALEVCALGEGANRHAPDHVSVAEDGTATLVSRGHVTRVSPDGRASESTIDPPYRRLLDASSLDGSTALLLTEFATERPVDAVELLIARAGQAPKRLAGAPTSMFLKGVRPAERPGEVFLFGHAPLGDRRPRVERCELDARADLVRCRSLELTGAGGCPDYEDKRAIVSFVALEGGDHLAVTSGGALIPIVSGEDTVPCLVGAQPPVARVPGLGDLSTYDHAKLIARGRRIYACMTAQDEAASVVFTATVGPLRDHPEIRWTQIFSSIDPRAQCEALFPDPRDPRDTLIILSDARNDYLRLVFREEGGVVTVTERDEVAFTGIDDVIVSAHFENGHWVIGGASGRVWTQRPNEAPVARWTFSSTPTPDANAIAWSEGRFSARAGALEVRASEGGACSGVTLTRVGAPSPARLGPSATLGAGRVIFTPVGSGQTISVRDASDAEVRTIALEGAANVVRAASIAGTKVVFLRDDGALGATDGQTAWSLDDSGRWVDLSSRPGLAWVIGPGELARILPDRDGGLRLDPVASVDRSAFDALARADAPSESAIHADACGGAILAYDDDVLSLGPDPVRVTVWSLEPSATGFALTPWEGYDPLGAYAMDSDLRDVRFVTEVPLMVVSARGPQAALVFAPKLTPAALPFGHVRDAAWNDRDALVGGLYGRVALIRTAP